MQQDRRTLNRVAWLFIAGCLAVWGACQVAAQVSPRGDKAPEPAAADWPQWRGPNRDGTNPLGSGLPGGWPPKKLWDKSVGPGCTSPVVAAGRVYVMGWQGKADSRKNPAGKDAVFCLDARTGKELWKKSYASRYQGRVRTGDTGGYGGPSSTPTFNPQTKHLYTLGVDGDLICWNTDKGGDVVWSKNLYEAYKVEQRPDAGGGKRDFGFTSSPLLLGDLLVVEVGSREGTVMAFDAAGGERRWRSECAEPAGHTSGPVAMTVAGKTCIATLTLRKLVVMRADPGHEGTTVAEYPWQTDYACNIATPAVAGNRVVLTSGYNCSKTSLIEITASGARERWTSRDFATVASPVIHKGRVYLVDSPLRCLDLASGNRLWRGGAFGHGSCLVTAGDDKLIVFGQGKLALVDASPKAAEYRELARVDKVVRGTCYPQVAFGNGFVICKDMDGHMVCFAVGNAPGGDGT